MERERFSRELFSEIQQQQQVCMRALRKLMKKTLTAQKI
jgi:hypothetical protein